MDNFKYKNRVVEVVRRPAQRNPRNAPVSSPAEDLPGASPLEMGVVEDTPWFSLEELKKRRFEE